MLKKIIAALAAVVLLVGLSACSESTSSDTTRASSKAQKEGQDETIRAFTKQRENVPYPAAELADPVERHNLRERLLRFNKPDKIGYVYLQSFGKFLGYWTIKGKISSTESQMSTDTLITKWVCPGNCADSVGPVNAPGDDGSYGPNEDMVFFFTTEGAMVEVPRDNVIYSDQPITLPGLTEFHK